MRLRCLTGIYAGQELEFSAIAGKIAIAEGRAEPIDAPARAIAPQPTAELEQSSPVSAGVIPKKRRGRPRGSKNKRR